MKVFLKSIVGLRIYEILSLSNLMCVKVVLILGGLQVTHFCVLALCTVAVSQISSVEFTRAGVAFIWSIIKLIRTLTEKCVGLDR